MSASEKLRSLLTQKIAELSSREEQLRRLSISTQALKGQIEGIQEALAAVESTEIGGRNGDQPEGKLTPAVLGLIQTEGTSPGLLPSEIVDKLLATSFQGKDRRQFYSSVYPVCQRLVKQGKIKEGAKRGKRSFMRIEPV